MPTYKEVNVHLGLSERDPQGIKYISKNTIALFVGNYSKNGKAYKNYVSHTGVDFWYEGHNECRHGHLSRRNKGIHYMMQENNHVLDVVLVLQRSLNDWVICEEPFTLTQIVLTKNRPRYRITRAFKFFRSERTPRLPRLAKLNVYTM